MDVMNPAAATITNVEQLEDQLSCPPAYLVEMMRRLEGDLMVLGVAGKMGPSLAHLARRASEAAAVKRRIIGVARFSQPRQRQQLESWGVETVRCDLLDEKQLAALPRTPHVIYMAGMKFGATGQEALTWAMNAWLPGLVCRHFSSSRIVAFSTGNVYGLCPLSRGGSLESDALNPVGEYALSCLGRERIFEHFSRSAKLPLALIRLNYACELRYGVLVDLARKIWADEPIDLTMGYCNVIWQGDASALALAALEHAASPPFVLNVTGPELLSLRQVCRDLAQAMNKPVRFTGTEAADALLSNGQLGHRLFGYPRVAVQQLLHWIAAWVMAGGPFLDKPTHFESRTGKF